MTSGSSPSSILDFEETPLDTRANGAMLRIGDDGQRSFFTLNGSHILGSYLGPS